MNRLVGKTYGIRGEFARAFFSWKIPLAILCILLAALANTMLEPTFTWEGYSGTVYDHFDVFFTSLPIRISLIICVVPYGISLCSDLEYRYIYPVLVRQSVQRFLFNRFVMVFLTAWFVMVSALMLYVVVLHHWMPWCDLSDTNYINMVAESGGFFDSLMRKSPLLFFVVYAADFGILPGILAVLSACISIRIPNRLLTLTLPFMAVYLLLDLSITGRGWVQSLNIWAYYDVLGSSIYHDLQMTVYGLVAAPCMFGVLYVMGIFLMKGRLQNG